MKRAKKSEKKYIILPNQTRASAIVQHIKTCYKKENSVACTLAIPEGRCPVDGDGCVSPFRKSGTRFGFMKWKES